MRSYVVFIVTLTFALALMSGCGGGGAQAVVRIVGTLLDDGSLQPVEDARVIASGVSGTTDANGAFDVADVPAEGTVTFAATGYQNLVVTLTGRTGEVNLGEVYMTPTALAGTGTVTGTVSEVGGDPADEATVTAGDCTALTREDGSYTLYNVPSGYQKVRALSHDRSTRATVNVTVVAGDEVTADLQLGIYPPDEPW